MKKLSVISVDWDYFISCSTEERFRLFPDGGNENLPLEIANFVWMSRYAESEGKIQKMQTLHSDLEIYARIYTGEISNVEKNMQEGNFDTLQLLNIDYHHDIYSHATDEINCGNWLLHLIEKYPQGSYTWFRRSDSEDLPEGTISDDIDFTVRTEDWLDDALDEFADAEHTIIYFCRSDVWTPPHLDSRFNALCYEFTRDPEYNTIFEPLAVEDRWSEQFISAMKIQEDTLRKIKGELVEPRFDDPRN
jgi:hypothetical protein